MKTMLSLIYKSSHTFLLDSKGLVIVLVHLSQHVQLYHLLSTPKEINIRKDQVNSKINLMIAHYLR